MPIREQVGWWSLALLGLVAFLWLLGDALLPFVLGAGLAYLSDPAAKWLQRHGFGRVMATVIITFISLGVVIVGLGLVIPVVVEQIRDAIERFPGFVDDARVLLSEWLPDLESEESMLSRAIESLRENTQGWSVSVLQKVWSGGLAIANFLTVVVVTPVVAFYLLMDWQRLVSGIDDLLPRQHRDTIRRLGSDLDDVISGFVRGQLTVCLILGTFYAIALTVVGLNFGLLIGLFAGLISFIPFVGAIMGGLLSVCVAAVQFWEDPIWIAAVAAIFAIGQAVEGNFLTPKLVGGKVGLHPVWLLFALSAFGALFGFVGMLVAVPAAAMIGVVSRFLLDQYKDGRLYRGEAAAGGRGDASSE